VDLSKVKDRESLKPRREPYWQRIRPGCFIGYRPSAREGAGTWIARAYEDDKCKYRLKALGDFGELATKDRFTAAKREAEAFAGVVESGGHVRKAAETVEDACKDYADDNSEAVGRFTRYVYSDQIAKVKLQRLRKHHLLEWRQRLEAIPALVSRNKKGEQRTRTRAPSSINRDMVVLRAALNRVLPHGTPGTDAAWQEALRPIRNADRQRTLRLDRAERRALLAAADAEVRPFLSALCLLPLRPGALASLTAGDYDKRTRELTIGKDKNGKPRRIVLPATAAELFAKQKTDKLPAAPLFTRANGKAWDKHTWKAPIKTAVKAAGLPAEATAYTLRHSVISELVEAGLPILTIAQISGTSVEMIERHYGHLNAAAAVDALAGLAL
jgi:site-specific recombinase XerD